MQGQAIKECFNDLDKEIKVRLWSSIRKGSMLTWHVPQVRVLTGTSKCYAGGTEWNGSISL